MLTVDYCSTFRYWNQRVASADHIDEQQCQWNSSNAIAVHQSRCPIFESLHDGGPQFNAVCARGGGALSATTLLWETHNLRNTLLKMKAGNPCA
jgi:hypothetical protein